MMLASENKRANDKNSHVVNSERSGHQVNLPVHFENQVPDDYMSLGNQARQHFVQSCPIRLPVPSSCPFGGICHSCTRPIQAKLKVSQPDDDYEREADRVADEVMDMQEFDNKKIEEIKIASRYPHIQRFCPECEEKTDSQLIAEAEMERKKEQEGNKKALQPKEMLDQTSKVTAAIECYVGHALRDDGERLPESVRSFFEPRFGYDISQVRIHPYHESSVALNACAYTVKNHIVFRSGEYDPESMRGKRLLAHELVHVLQQGGMSTFSSKKNTFEVSNAEHQSNLNSACEYPTSYVCHYGQTLGKCIKDRSGEAVILRQSAGGAGGASGYDTGGAHGAGGGEGVYKETSENGTGGAHGAGGGEAVYKATREVFTAFVIGKNLYGSVETTFGPSHPWTQMMQTHPHMEQVRSNIISRLQTYCQVESGALPFRDVSLIEEDDFNLNDLSILQTADWLGKDALNWISLGTMGQESAFLYGSFRLYWVIHSPLCSKGICSALVNFYATDVAHLRSANRIPKLNIPLVDIPDQPLDEFVEGWFFNNIPIFWYWRTQFIVSY